MKAVPLTIHWHDSNQPIYSAHFEQGGKGRLATAGGDNNVRLWKIEGEEEKKVVYLSTLIKHTQAVNVVRFCPRGELLASAGDDGNVILWVPTDPGSKIVAMGDESFEDKETWRLKHMCRSMGSEIYDLAWSPDGAFFITGSMDNVARVWNTQTGACVRQIAEHSHYVQGVAWDPLNEFVATQSSDRSVHIYALRTKDGQFSLSQHGKIAKMDLPARRISSGSPAPPDLPLKGSIIDNSPIPSTPGTPNSFPLPMNPPRLTPSRRSSFSSSRRSTSPAPAMPLPAVKPMEFSPRIYRNTNIYYNETLTSFFRRLTFTPDGGLLLTPAGQYKITHPPTSEGGKQVDEIINTVYIYSRAGLNKPPVSHLPGHKKPSVAIRCSPKFYALRTEDVPTKNITIDSSGGDTDAGLSLPPPLSSEKAQPTTAASATAGPTSRTPPSSTNKDSASSSSSSTANPPPPPVSAFNLPYRMVYAVATQDAVFIYDTQQTTPLCVISNLHYAAFTDLTWSADGLTLLMTSSDGYCSVVLFDPSELGDEVSPPVRAKPAAAPLGPPVSPSPTSSGIAPIFMQPSPPTNVVNDPIPTLSAVPNIVAASSSPLPPPRNSSPSPANLPPTPASSSLGKRDEPPSETPSEGPKRRRIAPTLIGSTGTDYSISTAPSTSNQNSNTNSGGNNGGGGDTVQ